MSAPVIVDLQAIPLRYRLTAAAFVAGVDVRACLSRATYYRHVVGLRALGLEIHRGRRQVRADEAASNFAKRFPHETHADRA